MSNIVDLEPLTGSWVYGPYNMGLLNYFTREKCVIQSDQSQACYERWRSMLVMNAVDPTSVIGQKKCVGNNA